MDDEDYDALIELFERRLTQAGLGVLADATLYMRRDLETGERVVLPPQIRLIEMLAAFERHMKAYDIRTYETALKRINSHLREGFVEGAVVEPAPGERSDGPIRLADAPSFAEPRERLEGLMAHLREAHRPRGTLL